MDIFGSVCLIPAKTDEIFLDRIIKELAQKYGSYPFVPHVTIYGLVKTPKETVERVIDYSVADSSPLVLKINSLAYSENFTKTLFLDFKMDDRLGAIYHRLKERLITYRDYELRPHLSLIYKNNMANSEKKKIIKNFPVKKEIIFDRIALITALKPIENEEDVKILKEVYRKRF